MNQQAMMKKIRQLQQEMMDTQAEIEATEFTESSGPVTIVMYGKKTIKSVKIDSDFVIEDNDDREMLEDAIVAASSVLIDEIDKYTEEKMSKYRSMLGGFGGF